MTHRIIIAGEGGQGVMLLGRVIAEAAMREDKFVTWLPAYGAEVRGGTANCTVIISDEEIGSPFVNQADSLIILNEPSFARFKSNIQDTGCLLANSSLVDSNAINQAHAKGIRFTDIAFRLGNIKAANMVALGAFIAKTKIISEKTARAVIKDITSKEKPELLRINIGALEEGMRLAQ